MALPDLIDTLTDLDVGEATPTELLGALSAVVTIRNLADHHAASITARIETLGIPEKQVRKIREILRDMGVAPYIAARWLRDGNALAATPELARMTGLGAMSGEHADAVVKGINHIDTRAREPLAADARRTYMTTLLAHAAAGAIPSEISSLAREIGNTLTDEDPDGIPAADDRRINTFDVIVEPDGRVTVRGDLHGVLGEKLVTAIDALSAPRPEPDGSRDARTPGQARSEAFETILDRASDADPTLIGAPKHQLLLTIPADTPDLATLDYVGPTSTATVRAVSCDATITEVVIADGVPLDISANRRLFPAPLRRALIVRDGCCIKCGVKGSRLHAHHIIHWANGGTTTLDNGCLLCPACHDDVHHNGWAVHMGADRHPWLIPPVTVDRHRQPQPSYNRRTLRLDDAA